MLEMCHATDFHVVEVLKPEMLEVSERSVSWSSAPQLRAEVEIGVGFSLSSKTIVGKVQGHGYG